MKINASIFKSYDIRGIYPAELNEEIAYEIGRVFVGYTGAKKVVIGQDSRLSSPALYQAIAKGITEAGSDVFYLGLVPTECVYFSTGHYDYDGGIMITASHNPKDYNGFKLVKKGPEFIKKGIEIIPGKEIGSVVEKIPISKPKKPGRIINIEIWQDYLKHILSFIDVKKIKPFKIAVDASNGTTGKVLSLLQELLPVEILPINFEADGNFPAHSPNPLLEGVTDQIKQAVLKEKADFGFIFDGDGDRIFLIDESGNFIKGDITLLLLAKYFLTRYPGSAVGYNLICSKAVPEFVQKWGGKPVRTPVGFVHVKDGMVKSQGMVSGEMSGHYIFRNNFYSDSGFIAFLVLLQIISESGKKVSELTSSVTIYAKGTETNFEVKNKETVLGKIKEKYSDGRQDYLDGITVEYNDWWFNLRPSNTEPILRLTIEAKNKELLEEKKKELSALISE